MMGACNVRVPTQVCERVVFKSRESNQKEGFPGCRSAGCNMHTRAHSHTHKYRTACLTIDERSLQTFVSMA